jgi:HEAT repeat protein
MLRELAQTESDAELRRLCVQTLRGLTNQPETQKAIRHIAFTDTNEAVASTAMRLVSPLTEHGDEDLELVTRLQRTFQAASVRDARLAVLFALGNGKLEARRILRDIAATDPDEQVRRAAARLAGQ